MNEFQFQAKGGLIGLCISLRSTFKAETGKDIIGWAIGPKEWLLLKQELEHGTGKEIKELENCTLLGLPVVMRAAPGVDLLVNPKQAGFLAARWEREQEEHKSKFVHAGNGVIN